MTATPTPRAPGVLTVKPIPGSAAAPAPAGADKKAAPASAGKVTAPLPTGPKSKAGKQSEAAANPEKQRETEKEQYSGWDGYSRTAFLVRLNWFLCVFRFFLAHVLNSLVPVSVL